MTISSTTNRVSYTGNGVTTAFAFGYKFLADADLKVYKDGTLQTITTHYTVSGAGSDSGGTVTFLAAPANGLEIVILRDPAITQGLDLVENDPLPAESVEDAFDKLTMIAQRLDDRIDRALILSDTETAAITLTLPSPDAGKALVWNATEDALENSTYAVDDAAAAAAASAAAASASASAASTSASNASTSASAAATSASNAATSETNAAASAAAAAASAANSVLKDGTSVMTGSLQMGAGTGVIFEGTTDNAYETTLAAGDPTADRTITLPDASGTLALTSDITSGASVLGMFRNLQASATGTNANITVTADEIALEDGSNSYYTARSVSLTIAGTSTGANALDAGTIAGSTWYSVWVIYNGATVAGLISTSATAPTMPSGYTYKARVGWIRTDGTANKYPLSFIQFGRRVSYKLAAGSNLTTWPQLASGASGSPTVPTWTAVAWANYAPSTSAAIEILTGTTTSGGGGTNYALVHSNNAAGSNTSTTAGPLIQAIGIDTGGSGFVGRVRGDIPIESSNIYWASTGASAFLNAVGWEDNI